MTLLDLTLADPAANLALDEALLLVAEEGIAGEVLRFWESSSYAVVVGAGGSVAIDVNVAACERDGVPILRRASGGGTVVIGPGCLCFSVVLRTDCAPGLDLIQPSTRYVMGRILKAVHLLVQRASIEGISDLTLEARKFSGSAQQRKRRFFLHHGTLLGGFDLTRLSQYLNAPERQPEYRQNRTHAEFVTNLAADTGMLKRLILAEWSPQGDYASVPMDRVQTLITDKYGNDSWNRRR